MDKKVETLQSSKICYSSFKLSSDHQTKGSKFKKITVLFFIKISKAFVQVKLQNVDEYIIYKQ